MGYTVAKGSIIDVRDLPPELVKKVASLPAPESEVMTLREVEREQVQRALKLCKNNISQASRVLGITRKRLYRIMRTHGLD